MAWLTALLAFAVTMLTFAIIVSTLVEMIHRIFNLRAKGMQLMLENLYDRVIKPKLNVPGSRPPSAEEFAALIMENRAAVTKDRQPDNILRRFIRWFVDWAVVTDIPTAVFTQKLADNRIVGAVGTLTEDAIKDIAQKYEAFGAEVTAYFESRARLFSVLIAFVVAWCFYVHPYRLAVSYFKNPEIAQAIADRAADVEADYAVLMEKLNHTADEGQQTNEEGTADLKKAIDALQAEMVEAKDETDRLRALGAPVGWIDLKPCGDMFGQDDCTASLIGVTFPVPSYVNAFWLLMGGLLVGLGAPFWAQAVGSLTASRDITRRIADIVTAQPPAAKAAAAPASPQLPPAVATFIVADKNGQHT